MQPGRVSKVHFLKRNRKKVNNGLRNWKTNTSYVDYNWFIYVNKNNEL